MADLGSSNIAPTVNGTATGIVGIIGDTLTSIASTLNNLSLS
ncbi:hypothetical protein [Rhodococcus tukisamuensis]|uniref:Uncharacterized protein n=1 Tax=Rhodococcus tukisamuensis TaxID=168276 RepID=A0A1G6MTK5_9NOCA|nr:hypothetical protein [Rhodococcus tukisamuensis]SDC58325.1 hypothetical protein SAMN05444580_101288 [Rhodococcus tukisamuensis]